eukprot:CAMPEP_0194284666 /NCGR_PEP_ID=MMETSP0169-20130528/28246_1 /TAXON_ID=218684 /ORGANISM="Corethron pennatum, Strain L29A3" /LENGTH=593 /DNA_ID=CAMNT_0039030551 /DNA_START=184 /DNA_END=1965 /DNA_ORIENTATION=+
MKIFSSLYIISDLFVTSLAHTDSDTACSNKLRGDQHHGDTSGRSCCSLDARSCVKFVTASCNTSFRSCLDECNAFWIDPVETASCVALNSSFRDTDDKRCCPPGRRSSEDDTCRLKVNPVKIRFSKIEFVDRSKNYLRLPLTSVNYDASSSISTHGIYDCLLKYTRCPSVITDQINPNLIATPGLQFYEDLLMTSAMPHHPSANPKDFFWKELRDVLEVRAVRLRGGGLRDGGLPWEVPIMWSNYTYADAAKAVHNEYPGKIQADFIQTIAASGPINVDESIIPLNSNAKFVGSIVMLAALNTWAVMAVGPTNFALKWKHGRVRPEEIVWLIAQNKLTQRDGVPLDILRTIRTLNLPSPSSFTAYSEGCPNHPSYPAMHSAASSISFWLSVVLDLTPQQEEEARRLDYAVSYARTVAGVHFVSDNVAGMTLGQELVARELPGYLEQWYGADAKKVREKIRKKRFSWFDYHNKLGGLLLDEPNFPPNQPLERNKEELMEHPPKPLFCREEKNENSNHLQTAEEKNVQKIIAVDTHKKTINKRNVQKISTVALQSKSAKRSFRHDSAVSKRQRRQGQNKGISESRAVSKKTKSNV